MPARSSSAKLLLFGASPTTTRARNNPIIPCGTTPAAPTSALPVANDPTRLDLKKFWIEESGALTLESDPLNAAAIKQLQEQRKAVVAANPGKPPPPPISIAAKQFTFMVNLSGDKSQILPAGINYMVPPQEAAPLPKIFEYMWPRMVDVTKALRDELRGLQFRGQETGPADPHRHR